MRKPGFIYLFFMLFWSCAVQTPSQLANEVLFTIEKDTTTADQFLYVYEKNNFNNDSLYTASDVDNYFNLFLNFKLKVAEAKDNGMDTTRNFVSEYNGYKSQLIKPYLLETKAQEKLVEEAYERLKYETDASHILVVVEADAQPNDTLTAWQKISEIQNKAEAGQLFDELAFEFSEDPSAKTNRGRLGYFTAFQMLYPFENASFNTPVDSISDIVRSKYGYHILKVHDRRPSSGKVKVSHIMLRSQSENDETARKKIFEIHEQLVQGADWNKLCKQYSEDQRTKDSGGTLPFIGLKQINDAAFESVAFNLQTPGEISDPVLSAFGWHIIKLEEKQNLASFEEMKQELEQQVSRDERSKLNKRAVIEKLKTAHNYKEIDSIRPQILDLADSSLIAGNWNIPVDRIASEQKFFSINANQTTVGEVLSAIEKQQRRRSGISPEKYMDEMLDDIVEKKLLENEEQQLIANNREFNMLLNEYYEGILLFDIMNEQVWGKAMEDTLGLRAYFEMHSDKYQWGSRAEAVIVSTTDPGILTNIKKSLHDESIKLMEIALELENNTEVADIKSVDSLMHLFQTYETSSIEVYCNEAGCEKIFYKNLMAHLKDQGLGEHIAVKPGKPGQGEIIIVELNSRSKKSLEYLYNTESALTLQVTEGLFEKGETPYIDSLTNWEKGTYEFEENGRHFLVEIFEIHSPQAKTLNDIKGKVISDYQEFLEKNWLSELKKKYAININYTTLDKIKKVYHQKLAADH